MSRLAYVVLLVSGFSLVLGSLYWYSQINLYVKNTHLETGRVISFESNGEVYRPKVGFESKIDGKYYEFVSDAGSNPPTLKVEEKVIVLYTLNPFSAKINNPFYLWFAPAIMGFLGIFITILTLFVYLFKRRSLNR